MNILGILTQPSGPPPVTVTGGTLFTDASFNYRLFTANGTLGVSGGTLTADVLVIAGGGGGGFNGGGGGNHGVTGGNGGQGGSGIVIVRYAL